LLGLTGLAGCGFAPVLANEDRGIYRFESADSVAGFRLREQLEQRLGAPEAPRYVIKTTLSLSERAAAITADGDTSRLNVIARSNWSLVEIATGEQLETGTVEAFTSYSATGSTVATQSTRDDARARVAVILADMIVSRVLLRTAGTSA
jgi:LPS-assembly lipoprotein